MNQCQSCGMPLEVKTTSKFDGRYCVYCQDQKTKELKPYEQVREGSIQAAMKLMGKTKEEAQKLADTLMPKLPRWKK